MNPLKWIRWKVLIGLVVIGGGLYFLGVNPLAQKQINGLGSTHETARWAVDALDLGFLAGNFELSDLLVSTPNKEKDAASPAAAASLTPGGPDEKNRVFSALTTKFDLSMDNLLRKRFVVDEIVLDTPKMRVERREDGSTNIGDLAGTDEEDAVKGEPGEDETPAEEKDWVETTKDWYEKIQKVREKLGGEDEEGEGADDQKTEEEKTTDALYALAAKYPFTVRPGVVVNTIRAQGLEIDFSDSDNPGGLASLTDGMIEILGVSNRPNKHSQPITLALSGKIGGEELKLGLDLDLTKSISDYGIQFETGKLPASLISSFIGKSLPDELKEGTIQVRAKLDLDGEENLNLIPFLSFQGVQLATKAGQDVAGQSGESFVRAFNEASKLLEDQPLDIADLTITGKLSDPKFNWGDTVKNLVVNGGKAFVQNQLRKAEDKARELVDQGTQKLEAERAKLASKVDAEKAKLEAKAEEEKAKLKAKAEAEAKKALGDKATELLGGSEAGKKAKESIGNLIPDKIPGLGGDKSADKESKKATDGAVDKLKDGIFGGFGKKKKKKD